MSDQKIRQRRRGMYLIHESLDYKVRKDLFINCDAIESLSIEMCNRKTSNTVFNVVYRPPNGHKNQ